MPLHHLRTDFSIEITQKDVGRLADARALVPAGTPIAITYLPGNKVADLADVAAKVRGLGFTPVPHISARRVLSEAELTGFLTALKQGAQIDRVFVVGGDPDTPMGPYEDAHAVIRSGVLDPFDIKKVGIGGYPEGNPAIPDDKLWRALEEKSATLAAQGRACEIVTQFGFNADNIVNWIAAVRARGIDAPIRLGTAGPTSVQQLVRFAARCGVAASGSILAKYGISITKLLSTATPNALLEAIDAKLAPAHGAVGLHLYPFGGVEKTAAWASDYLLTRAAA